MKIRNLKENVLYFIFALFCMEYVRVKYNKLGDQAKRKNWNANTLFDKQSLLLKKASLVYSVFFSLILMNFFTTLTYRIMLVYSDAVFLKTNAALVVNFIVSYCLSYIIIGIFLRYYIKSMNGFTDFWKKIGRSAWDGTKLIMVDAPIKAGMGAKNKVGNGLRRTGNFLSAVLRKIKKNKE